MAVIRRSFLLGYLGKVANCVAKDVSEGIVSSKMKSTGSTGVPRAIGDRRSVFVGGFSVGLSEESFNLEMYSEFSVGKETGTEDTYSSVYLILSEDVKARIRI